MMITNDILCAFRSFTENPYAQALYFFKAQYFILSAQQCVSGFPKRVLGYFISKNYNLFASLAFQGYVWIQVHCNMHACVFMCVYVCVKVSMCVFSLHHSYRLIPILPDLKEVMDWMFTDTSLKLFHWLKVQEIWAQLYIIKNLRKREKVYKLLLYTCHVLLRTVFGLLAQNNPRVLGQLEGLFSKLMFGGGLLVLFILLIWGPLIAFSAIVPTNASNPPIEVTIQVQLGSFEVCDRVVKKK